MKEKELKLLAHFRSNARKNLTRISKETGVPISTIFDKLKKYEGSVIKKFTSLLDYQKLGYDVRVKLILKVAKEDRENLRSYLIKNNNINSVFRITEGFDFIAEGIFRNMQEVYDFSRKLEQFNIIEKEQYFILEDLKREEFLNDPEAIKLLNPSTT